MDFNLGAMDVAEGCARYEAAQSCAEQCGMLCGEVDLVEHAVHAEVHCFRGW